MGYSVETSGQLLLPQDLEKQALTVLEVELAGRQGPWSASEVVDTLEELAWVGCTSVRREGDWLHLAPDLDGDPKWSDQATGFYVGLARWVQQGEVRLVGEDGARWSYRYAPDGVIQVGQNGWDGSLVPFGEPVHAAGRSSAAGTGFGDASEQPRSRVFAMTMLLLVGLVLIIGIAVLGAGLAG